MAHFGTMGGGQEAGQAGAGMQTQTPGLAGDVGIGSVGMSKKWTPTQPIVLALVVMVSGGALYAMRTIGIKHAIAFDAGKQFEFDANKDASFEQEYNRVIGELSSVNNPLDIALIDFGRSPFALKQAQEALTQGPQPILPTALGPSAEERLQAERAKRRGIVEQEAAKLVVQSVMAGRVPLARINDEVVRMGDKVGDIFIVTHIEGRSVTVEAEGQKFVLNMVNPGDEQHKNTKKRRN